ncbi:MAG: hypothetical protein KC502_23515 [Myxococcales bacterium]|nr:hypothetical protein [Myxococcales bacterium]
MKQAHLSVGVTLACALWLTGCAGPQTTQGVAKGRGAPVAERGPGQTARPNDAGAAGKTTGKTRPPALGKAKGMTTTATGPWRVNMSPRAKVGERFRMKLTASMSQLFATRVDGQERKREIKRTIVVDAVGEVLEVNDKGQIIVSKYVIGNCVGSSQKGERELLSAGTVLRVRRTGPKPRMDADSGAISRQDQAILRLAFSTSNPQSTDQEMFGTSARVQVGEQWTIDTDKTAELLAKAGAIVHPADLSGSTTLASAKRCGKTMCLGLLTQFSATGVRMKAIPPQATVVDSGITGTSRRSLPVVGGRGPATSNDRFAMHLIVSVVKNDKDIEVEARVSTEEQGVWLPLP